MQEYNIYAVEKYNSKRENLVHISSNNINIICDELMVNKGYHQIFSNNEKYILFFDLDNIIDYDNDEYEINEFINQVTDLLDISKNHIKYTKSIKPTEKYNHLSYHVTIPIIYSDLDTIKTIAGMIHNCTMYVKDFMDLSVYAYNRYFRLPNQTNKDKPLSHTIIKGEMKDFVLNHIPNNSKLIILNNDDEINNDENKARTRPRKQPDKKDNYIYYDQKYYYEVEDNVIEEMLNKLDDKYLDEYKYWSIITNILKGLNKYELWKNWSKKSNNKYNLWSNNSIWRSTKKIKFTLEHLNKFSKSNIKFKKKLILNKNEVKPNIIDTKYLVDQNNKEIKQFTYEEFKNNTIIIIESNTGTGKTAGCAKHFAELLLEYPNLKLLNIVDRITLSDQIVQSFQKENVNILSYQLDQFSKDNHYTVCINSLLKLTNISNNELKNYVVYIDEINSFIKTLLNSNQIEKIRPIFILLIRIIKNCYKIIVSDNIITDNVFNLLDVKDGIKYFIQNVFKKYKDVNAVRVRNENLFIDKINNDFSNNRYFLFGSDSCSKIEDLYKYFMDKYPNLKNQMLLITSNYPFKIKNASEQFRDKYVFYSPSIVTAVDFSIDTKQNVYIYSRGGSIDPSDLFQQVTRTRNIDTLYYYCEKRQLDPNFDDLDTTKDYYKKNIQMYNSLMNVCYNDNDNNEIENLFFEMFCYQKYISDTYNTNFQGYFEQILVDNQLVIKEEGKYEDLKDEIINKINDINVIYDDKLFDDFIKNKNGEDERFNLIRDRIELLNLPINNNEILIKYKDYITGLKLKDHYDIIRFFKNDVYVNTNFEIINRDGFNVKNYNNIYAKLKLFREIESDYKLNISCNNTVEPNFTDEKWEYIKNIFNSTKDKPKTIFELNKLYVHLIKHLTTSEIIIIKRKMVNKERLYTYNYNKTFIRFNIELNNYYNKHKYLFNKRYKNIIGFTDDDFIKPKNNNEKLDKDLFIDDEY